MDRRLLACGFVLMGLLLCGCSGSGDDSSGTKEAAPASQPAESGE